jgi:hypothetical protein
MARALGVESRMEVLLNVKRVVSVIVAVTLIAAFVPTAQAVGAGPEPTGSSLAPTTRVDLRSSIDRAATRVASDATLRVRPGRSPRLAVAQTSGGGGGGGGMALVMLLSTAAGLAATYLIMKEMRRQGESQQQSLAYVRWP